MTQQTTFDEQKIIEGTKLILQGIGDDPTRGGLRDTPKRVAKMYADILNGYQDEQHIQKHIRLFDEPNNETMVIIKDVPFYSFCEHHLLPFFGKLHVAYIPKDGKILGVSKLIRVARVYAKRPQVQERLVKQIAQAINTHVPNQGVAVSLIAKHMCMSIRGVRTPDVQMVTTDLQGLFKLDDKARNEFLAGIAHGN